MKKKVSKVTEKFLALSKPEQRVKIAKDVIAQLKAERIYATTGCYIRLSTGLNEAESAQDNLKNIGSCTVCALGSTMVSITKFANNLTIGELKNFNENDKAKKMLQKYFPLTQLSLIEYAFEGFKSIFNSTMKYDGIAYEMGYKLSERQYEKTYKFYSQYDNPTDRLIAIMRNIVANSGTFKP